MERGEEVVIVGGGPVGAALAIALAGSGTAITVLEARPDVGKSGDDRTLAISYGASLILRRIGVWDAVAPVTPIDTIHVSQRGGYGRSLLTAAAAGLPALGYVLRYAALQRALGARLAALPDVSVLTGAFVESVQPGSESATCTYRRDGRTSQARARLLVLADGSVNLAEQAGAAMKSRDYAQQAVVATVVTSRPQRSWAYERFTTEGPAALLPFEDRYALVWTANPPTAERLCAEPDADFLRELQAHFGDRAGRFLAVGPRARFPLSLRYALDPVLRRTVLLGNAAQALHPVAGQGFNLGLRDAWELGDAVRRVGGPDPGAAPVLSRYRAQRRLDRIGGIAVTDSLVRIFSNDNPPLRALRGGGLALLDVAGPLKRAFIERLTFGSPL